MSCDADGTWPSGVANPDILVRWTGTDWEFEGRSRLEAAQTRVAFEYYSGSPEGVYIALVGLTGERALGDFLDVARDQELGRYHVRRGHGSDRWEVPEWVSFVGSVEHGCQEKWLAPHRAVRSYSLPAGRYVVLGHSRRAAAEGSLAEADLIVEFDVVGLRASADECSIRLTQCRDPRCTDKTETRLQALADCEHRVEVALDPAGLPQIAYVNQPHGDPLCGSDMNEWTGEVRLIECLDTACSDSTERTLAEVEYLWAGPYELDTAVDGTVSVSFYVASSGHPVTEVTHVTAACGTDSCQYTELGTLRPWDIAYGP